MVAAPPAGSRSTPETFVWFESKACLLPLFLSALVQIRAVFAACAVLLLGGWVDAKQAVGHVNWGLLLLIGSALGFSKAMANSGLADMAGRAVRESGMSESASLYALFGLTMVRRMPVFSPVSRVRNLLNPVVALGPARRICYAGCAGLLDSSAAVGRLE